MTRIKHYAGDLILVPQADLHQDVGDPDDDEAGYRFANHRFVPGEYVSIKEHDDVLRTFRVIMVQPLE